MLALHTAAGATSKLALCAQTPGSSPPTAAADRHGEKALRVELLDNGDFSETDVAVVDDAGRHPIPWWRSSGGLAQVEHDEHGSVLRTRADEFAEQPIAAYAPLCASVRVRGSVRGHGIATLLDSDGVMASYSSGGDATVEHEFELDGRALQRPGSPAPRPRLILRLGSAPGGEARWRQLSCSVELPCPSESELRAELLVTIESLLAPWLERGFDDEGPRPTGFLVHTLDALTGERLNTIPGGFHPLFAELGDLLAVEEVPAWRSAYERFLGDFLELGLDLTTGLPCLWDPAKDEPLPEKPTEIGLAWSFLIDVAERGPEKFRARARAAAIKIGETVLARGILPDGNVGASYFPRNALVNTGIVQLRRFDVLAPLARLTALTKDPRYYAAASEALSTFEFTHLWSGIWTHVDPGFDDEFGHYGTRAVTIAASDPTETLFRHFAIEGFEHYAAPWRDALRLGGNVAADQVRCWSLIAGLARVEPSLRGEAQRLLSAAVRSHFKGEQYDDGAWGDVTIFDFDPVDNLQVGDYPGVPQNLLNGLAVVYDQALGLRTDATRAKYTAVLRSSIATYSRPFGFLLERRERKGPNSAAGTLRMLLGLSKMFERLSG